jgi:hypothetical protein
MNNTLRTQATAFGLAAVVTLSLMASIHQLAVSPTPADTLAHADSAPVQVVVVTGKRTSS